MKQQGAALVIVMALLSGALILGVSGMNSALIDERLAGNYRASVQAQMNSDSMMSDIHSAIIDDPEGKLNDLISDVGEESKIYTWDDIADLLGFDSSLDNTEKMKVEVKVEGDDVIIKTQDDGTNNNAVRETVARYQRGSGGNGSGGGPDNGSGGDNSDIGSPPFESPVVGCAGVSSGGGSTISSYRSSEGVWNGMPGSFSEQDIPIIRTTTDGANIVLGDGEQIHGGIETLGTVTLNGSSEVYGNIKSNNDIDLNTSNFIHGDVASKGKVIVGPATVTGSIFSDGNVTLENGGSKVEGDVESFANINFSESGRVDGVVKSMGDVDLRNWAASVGRGIYAQGEIYSPRNPPYNPPEGHVDNGNFFPNTPVSIAEIEEIESQPCDTVDFLGNSLREEIIRYQDELTSIGNIIVGNHPNFEWRVTPQEMKRYDQTWDIDRWVTHASSEINTSFGEQASIYRVNDLKLTGSSSLTVSGGDVVIVVDGDFNMDGGGDGLVIDEDSSLTVFVAGEVDFDSVLDMPEANSINSNGDPTFSLFSGYSGSGTGVNFSSNNVVANVYAPYTDVSVNSGARFFGSVKGRTVSVSGGSSIIYDELLAGTLGGPSNGSPETEGDSGWQLVDWQ